MSLQGQTDVGMVNTLESFLSKCVCMYDGQYAGNLQDNIRISPIYHMLFSQKHNF